MPPSAGSVLVHRTVDGQSPHLLRRVTSPLGSVPVLPARSKETDARKLSHRPSPCRGRRGTPKRSLCSIGPSQVVWPTGTRYPLGPSAYACRGLGERPQAPCEASVSSMTAALAPRMLRRAARDVAEGCYLVDPASSHMLVSKIKPCMCKYELIQTVKLRMAH